ncbi:MAG TPA: RibD family protein [Paracoccaceae bacterium]|nr:RibD family protein [Paracoccaceae bacterium]
MHRAEVTDRLWDRVLDIREGRACACCGTWAEAERAALDLYATLARRDAGPVTVAQIGQSLDGRVATVTGDARDISGPDGLAHLHRMRALVDAVVVGVRTALHDNPRLTVRLARGRNPARVIIDPQGRLPDDAAVLAADGVRRIVVQSVDRPRPPGVEVIRLPRAGGQGMIDPAEILAALRDLGLGHVLIEGGAITITQFLEAGLLTRLHVAVAPLIIGAGPQGLTTANPVQTLAAALRPAMRVYGLGTDVVFDCALAPEVATLAHPAVLTCRHHAARLVAGGA